MQRIDSSLRFPRHGPYLTQRTELPEVTDAAHRHQTHVVFSYVTAPDNVPANDSAAATQGFLSPWRAVFWFGIVSLLGDLLYEGMRSIAGPLLGSLGASALTVGMVTGAGEGIALVLRLVAGQAADRTQRHWLLAGVGYGLTAVCVPLLAITPALGVAGVAVASSLILAERTGKALRSPSKSVLLATAAGPIGQGKGFGVHKALDQVGAFSGPLIIAAMLALTGQFWPGLALMAIPGAALIVLLLVLRQRMPPLPVVAPSELPHGRVRLPRAFHEFGAASALTGFGMLTFGIFGYHLARADVVATAWVPVVYALAMAVAGVSALGAGWIFDRVGPRNLLLVPLLIAPVPALVLTSHLGLALLGIVLWGVANGVQDSSVKALVVSLVPRSALGTGFGVFAAYQGTAALLGGVAAGALYEQHRGWLIALVVAAQVLAYWPLTRALRAASPTQLQ